MFLTLKNRVWGWWQNRPWRWLFLWIFPVVVMVASVGRRRSIASSEQISKVLIFHFGAIGDALMTTPAIRLLGQHYPAASIHFMTASRSATDIYLRNAKVARVSYLPQYDCGNIKERFHQQRSLWRDRLLLFTLYPTLVIRVLMESYDLGIALGPLQEGATFSNLLFDLVGIPVRVGALGAHTNRLTHAADPSIAGLHWVDLYREILKALVIKPSAADDSLEYTVADDERKRATEFLAARGIEPGRPIAVIHPGGNLYINSKRWAPEKFAEVADSLGERFSSVVLTGSADEKEVAEQVRQTMRMPAVNAAGELTFGETAALLQRAELLITNDTGILHLADAVGVPEIVSIFGPTDQRKIAPRNSRHGVVAAALECAPCIDFDAGDPSKRCWRTVKEECLKTISVADVLAAVSKSRPEITHPKKRAAVGGQPRRSTVGV
jgi:heptosyltransferase-2